jgi:hypothetical protein
LVQTDAKCNTLVVLGGVLPIATAM